MNSVDDPKETEQLQDLNRLQSEITREATFSVSKLKLPKLVSYMKPNKVDFSQLGFGSAFTPHMLKIEYQKNLGGWQNPEIVKFGNLSLHPASKIFHYAVTLFEGIKAYRGPDGKIIMFRPEMNMVRMNASAKRAGLPTFDGMELIKCMNMLIEIDEKWVPDSKATSLYIRPTLIGTDPILGMGCCKEALLFVIMSPVGSYFSQTNTGVSLLADPRFTRAWPGGCGDRKMGSNYAPTFFVQQEAVSKGLQQVLWLYGDDDQLTEAGTMNIFIVFRDKTGEKQLVTPPLNGLILPGITRNSILILAKELTDITVTEREINMSEICMLHSESRKVNLVQKFEAAVEDQPLSKHQTFLFENLKILKKCAGSDKQPNQSGWQDPKITELENLSLHPAAKVFHYAIEIFEGMKAYRGQDGVIRMFRPRMNMIRMNLSAKRSGLPTFDGKELIKCLDKLIELDQHWVPHTESTSLYIRPTMIGIDAKLGIGICNEALLFVVMSPVGSYFSNQGTGVSLLAEPRFTRAWPGGCGDKKMGANYGPTIYVQEEAASKGFQQVLWLFGDEHQLTEAGTMNLFVLLINAKNEKELVTPPLNGLILPGITRNSVLHLAREQNEYKVSERVLTMSEFYNLHSKKKILEVFGTGTACTVCPISCIFYQGKSLEVPKLRQENSPCEKFKSKLTDIQYGKIAYDWPEPSVSDFEITVPNFQMPCTPKPKMKKSVSFFSKIALSVFFLSIFYVFRKR